MSAPAQVVISWPDGTVATYLNVQLEQHTVTPSQRRSDDVSAPPVLGDPLTFSDPEAVTAYSLVIRGTVKPRETDGRFYVYENTNESTDAPEAEKSGE